MPFLKSDIVGGSSGKLYGKRGDQVTVISSSSDTWIVEKSSGERFPVSRFDLSEVPQLDALIPVAPAEQNLKTRARTWKKPVQKQVQKTMFD